MPLGPSPLTGNALNDLGLGLGADLADQVKNETDEQRKKRLLQQQMSTGAQDLLGGGALGGMTGGGIR